MDNNLQCPIVILSDDDEDDDVVFVNNESGCKENDVIFISENPSPFKLKKTKVIGTKDIKVQTSEVTEVNRDSSKSRDGYSQSIFTSSVNMFGDILQPVLVADAVTSTSQTSFVIKPPDNVKPSQAVCTLESLPTETAHSKPNIEISNNDTQCLFECDLDTNTSQNGLIPTTTSLSQMKPPTPLTIFSTDSGLLQPTQEISTETSKIKLPQDLKNVDLTNITNSDLSDYYISNFSYIGDSFSQNNKQNKYESLYLNKNDSTQKVQQEKYISSEEDTRFDQVITNSFSKQNLGNDSGRFIMSVVHEPYKSNIKCKEPLESEHSKLTPFTSASKGDSNIFVEKQFCNTNSVSLLDHNLNIAKPGVSTSESDSKLSSQPADLKAAYNDLFTLLGLSSLEDLHQRNSHEVNNGSNCLKQEHENGIIQLDNSLHRNFITVSSPKKLVAKPLTVLDFFQDPCLITNPDQQSDEISSSSSSGLIDEGSLVTESISSSSSSSVSSNRSNLYCVPDKQEKSFTSITYSQFKDNHLRDPNNLITPASSKYLNHAACGSDKDNNPIVSLKSNTPSSQKEIKKVLVKRIQSKSSKKHHSHEKKHKHNMDNCQSTTHSKPPNSEFSRKFDIKDEKTDKPIWQMIYSESSKMTNDGVEIDDETYLPGGKRTDGFNEPGREKHSLKVTFKRYPSLSDSRCPSIGNMYSTILNDSISERPADLIVADSSNVTQPITNSFCLQTDLLCQGEKSNAFMMDNSSNGVQPKINTTCLKTDHFDQSGMSNNYVVDNSSNGVQQKINVARFRTDPAQSEMTQGKIKEIKMCSTCYLNVYNDKHSQCGRDHIICAACLECQVRAVLLGTTKKRYIKCPAVSCFEVIHFDEMKKALPFFVVDVLEEKLNKEYMNYITQWMFTNDKSVKPRAEFAGLDTPITLDTLDASVSKLDATLNLDTLGATMILDSLDTYLSLGLSVSTIKQEEVNNNKSKGSSEEDLPPYWAPMEQDALVMAFEVIPDTEEYRSLAFNFYDTMDFGEFDIVRIIRIQNKILWKYFTLKQTEMKQENDGVNVEEKQLFHGTYRTTLEAIARKGFDWRLSGKHGSAYGCGSYFASNSRYSHAYTDRAGSGHRSFHLLPQRFNSYFSRRHTSSLRNSLHPYDLNRVSSLTLASKPTLSGHGHLSTLNFHISQASLNATSGQISGTSSKASSLSDIQGLNLGTNYQHFSTCSTFTPSSFNSFYNSSLAQPTMNNSTSSFTSPNIFNTMFETSCNTLKSSVKLLGNTDNQSDNDNSEIYGINNLNTNKLTNSLTTKNDDKGTTDLTQTFSRDSNSMTHFMFMAKVLVGRYTVGRHGLKRPPPLDESNPYRKSYDSCVDRISNPEIYVIFDRNQAYPEYVVEYNWHKGS